MFAALENHFLYYPVKYPDEWMDPDEVGLSFQDVTLTTLDGETVHGWLLPETGAQHALLFCHGNGGHMAHRLDLIQLYRDILNIPVSILIFDYRGYGKSSGIPSETNIYEDTAAMLDHLVHSTGFPLSRIIVLGRSLGAAAALHIALRRPTAGLILECPFLSVSAMSRQVFGFFRIPACLLRQKFDCAAMIRRLTTPVAIIHGDCDRIVPFRHGVRLFELAAGPRHFMRVPGAGHDDIAFIGRAAYAELFNRFFTMYTG